MANPANSSQESFHSTQSRHPPTPPPHPHPTSHPTSPPASPPSSSNTHPVASQSAGLPVYDVDAYLNEPKNQALLSANSKNPPTTPRQRMKSQGNVPDLPSGSPKTSHHVAMLYMLCQKRGIVPEFEIEGDHSGFGGWLKVGSETISREERWPCKRDAKEGLAERGVEVVKGMLGNGMENKGPVALAQQTNWVGLLQAFHYGAIADGGGPVYTEYDLGGIFACTCIIPSCPDSFGSASDSFPSKKAARANAAREAMMSLIDQGLTNPDGTLKARKKVKLGTAVRVENKKLEVKRDATYAQRVNDLCPILGLAAPTYRLSAGSASAPNLLSGAAYFPGEPRFPDKYGEVRNIFGKKAAKEECARGVWEVLRELAANRGVDVGLEDETDEGFT